MSKVSLRRLLSRLTALALAASPATAGATELRIAEELAMEHEIDRELIDAEDAAAALGRGLALALTELRPIVGTHLAASWAISTDGLRRLAVANALEWSFPLVGDDVVIDHLSRDPDPAVRCAVARAAWIRGADASVLSRLAADPDPQVRSVALGR
ncbi:MAG: hypothetical protein WKG01_28065 [Kofleriaceae bacterium]